MPGNRIRENKIPFNHTQSRGGLNNRECITYYLKKWASMHKKEEEKKRIKCADVTRSKAYSSRQIHWDAKKERKHRHTQQISCMLKKKRKEKNKVC